MGKISGVDASLITSIMGVQVSVITKVGPVLGTSIGLGGTRNTNPVYFVKANYSTSTVDQISSFVTLARGNNQALYNVAAEESSYSHPDSPLNTEWNADGGNLSNYASRTYTNFTDALQYNVGIHILEKPLIMHDINDDKYYLIQFHTWTQGNNGGGFSYTRLRLDDAVTYAKADYNEVIPDNISEFVALGRGNNGGLYNTVSESHYEYPSSPINTEWNGEGGDLSNYATRTYTNFAASLDYSVGSNIMKKPLIMHDINDDKYYAIIFTSWTQNNSGGGLSYARILLKPGAINSTAKIFTNDFWSTSADACTYGQRGIDKSGSQTLYYNSGDNHLYTDAGFTTPFNGMGNYWWDQTDNKWWWVDKNGGVIDSYNCA